MNFIYKKSVSKLRKQINDTRHKLNESLLQMGDAAYHNGDLRENFAYMELEKQVHTLNAKIVNLKQALASTKQFNLVKNANKINIGVKFKLQFSDKTEATYILGGDYDTKYFGSKFLNINAPLGKALVGAKLNSTVRVGPSTVKVIKIY